MLDQAGQYDNVRLLASRLVHSITLATFKNTSFTTKDSNTSKILGDRNESRCLTYVGYEPESAIDSFIARKLALGVPEPKESKGSSTRGAR